VGAFLSQTRLGLILAFRNRMALIYGFVFPLMFLVAFWAIYRHEEVPIALHLGELLTVTILGGACFGLPTTLVSERERGVWRRYRLTPAPGWLFVLSTLTTRYVLILAAALLQIALALMIGMPPPAHPFDLFVAFTLTAIAFLGLGMVIAALADNVPAVQALGQCIFLPMLMIGGVAVRLSSLPDWALHTSAFFPGRYAVQALQSATTGGGLPASGFDLLALILIGAAACIAATGLFRWDQGPAPKSTARRAWLALAVGMWAVVGIMAQLQDRIRAVPPVVENVGAVSDFLVIPRSSLSAPKSAPLSAAPESPEVAVAESAPAASPSPTADSEPPPAPVPARWQDVSADDWSKVAYDRLPPDDGLIAPLAPLGEVVDDSVADRLERLYRAMRIWGPGFTDDPVQRARNYLYVAAVADLSQMADIERYLPAVVLAVLREDIAEQDLPKVLYWIATHPEDGDLSALDDIEALGLPPVTEGANRALQGRVMLYAFKLLGRVTGVTRQ